jgi:hypothetical protein
VEIAHLAALLGELTGRRLPQRTAPDWVLQPRRPPGRPRAAREPVRLPVSAEQVDLPFSTPAGVVVDDTATRHELAVGRRELRETLADTEAGWPHGPGHRPSGRLARQLTCPGPITGAGAKQSPPRLRCRL